MDSKTNDVKVYIYILKSEATDTEIYAYTIAKDIAKLFESQRNMDLFYKITKRMDKYNLMYFMNNNKSKQICKDFLYDGKETYEIASTIYESDVLSESCDQIHSTLLFIRDEFNNDYRLKKKYLKLINELTDSLIDDDGLNLDTFKIFYSLFSHTFNEEIIIEESLY